jgi:hypothetical protein
MVLNTPHIQACLDFAEHHLHWTVDDWKRVIFSDETKINRLGSDGQHYAWNRKGESLSEQQVQPTLKFGAGSLMVVLSWCGGVCCGMDLDLPPR